MTDVMMVVMMADLSAEQLVVPSAVQSVMILDDLLVGQFAEVALFFPYLTEIYYVCLGLLCCGKK